MKRTSMGRLFANEKGVITVDYLFAFVLVMGFTALLFAVSLTLTVVEMTQYLTFASARNFFASHVSEDDQRERALLKYQEISGHPVFASMYSSGWFDIQADPIIGDVTLARPDIMSGGKNLFWGTATDFFARMLDFEIPFYGSTASDGDGSGDGFKTFIASYLGREPTINECLNLNLTRWELIKQLDNAYSGGNYPANVNYVVIADNGC